MILPLTVGIDSSRATLEREWPRVGICWRRPAGRPSIALDGRLRSRDSNPDFRDQNPRTHLNARDALRPRLRPPGAETAWAYTHVSQHARGDAGGGLTGPDSAELDAYVERMGAEIERHAHGFRKMIVGRNGRPETPSKNLLRVKQSPFPSEPYAYR